MGMATLVSLGFANQHRQAVLKPLGSPGRLSLRELAKLAGVDVFAIHRTEVGTEEPRFGTLEKLARALGVSVRDLIEK